MRHIQGLAAQDGVVTASVTASDLIGDIPVFAVAVFTVIFLFNKKNREAVLRVWEKKWMIAE